jgi:hypothetical protein
MTTAQAVEGWELGEVLAAFRQVARDAREAQCAPQPPERSGGARRLTATEEGEVRQ